MQNCLKTRICTSCIITIDMRNIGWDGLMLGTRMLRARMLLRRGWSCTQRHRRSGWRNLELPALGRRRSSSRCEGTVYMRHNILLFRREYSCTQIRHRRSGGRSLMLPELGRRRKARPVTRVTPRSSKHRGHGYVLAWINKGIRTNR